MLEIIFQISALGPSGNWAIFEKESTLDLFGKNI